MWFSSDWQTMKRRKWSKFFWNVLNGPMDKKIVIGFVNKRIRSRRWGTFIIYLSIYPSVVRPSERLSVRADFRPSVHPTVHPSIHLSIHPSIHWNLFIRSVVAFSCSIILLKCNHIIRLSGILCKWVDKEFSGVGYGLWLWYSLDFSINFLNCIYMLNMFYILNRLL